MSNIGTTIYDIMSMTRKNETMPNWALAMKLAEECGEVNEAVLVEVGFMPHKGDLKDDVMHEVADVFNVCIGLLVQHYPDMPVEILMNEFNHALYTKGEKYRSIVENLESE